MASDMKLIQEVTTSHTHTHTHTHTHAHVECCWLVTRVGRKFDSNCQTVLLQVIGRTDRSHSRNVSSPCRPVTLTAES